jgi:hypothetical protein
MEKHFRTIFWSQNKDSRLKKCENYPKIQKKKTHQFGSMFIFGKLLSNCNTFFKMAKFDSI